MSLMLDEDELARLEDVLADRLPVVFRADNDRAPLRDGARRVVFLRGLDRALPVVPRLLRVGIENGGKK